MPKPFRFATVKRVRELFEKKEQREFAAKRQAVLALSARIEEFEARKTEVMRRVDQMRRECFTPQSDLLYVRYIRGLDDLKKELGKKREEALARLEEQKTVMLKAMKDRKIMDVLLEKHDLDSRMEEYREESKRLSETAILRFGRIKQSP